MSDNFGRCASLAVDNALDALRRLTNLSPASFDRIRAEIAGEWRCDTCASEGKGLDDGLCYTTGYLTGAPCAKWQAPYAKWQENKEDGDE